jgi:hypothetical protein
VRRPHAAELGVDGARHHLPSSTRDEEDVVDVLILQVFVSLVLVTGSVILFLVTCKSRTFDHADRLALLPIEKDDEKGRNR